METESITFKDLGLSPIILDALNEKGFEKPSPIQAQTIPLMLSDERDIIGQAQTGTGKTAAFGLPILETLSPTSGHIQALILTPTRELTIQVSDELHSLMGKKKLRITPIYGGQSIEKQIQQLKKPTDIIVGTPGRLIDHLNRNRLDLSYISHLVLDEADEMLTSGFLEEIEIILSKTNPQRKTLLFSATMPKPIQHLAETYMKDYVTIQAKKSTLATSLTDQIYFETRESDKLEALCRIIDVEDQFYGLIFCRTKRDVDAINEKLIHRGYESEAMHGDLSQHQRERVLDKFRRRLCTILVVTDVASRGLDISQLSHVINYALPQDPESYVHRVGRTGRAGQSGTAITFITPSEYRKLMRIQKIAQTDIKKKEIPTVKTIIKTKKTRLKETIYTNIESTVPAEYYDFADDLLANHSPKDALASVLKVAFEDTFSVENYKDIKPGRSNSDRNYRSSTHVDVKGQTRLFIAKGRRDKMDARKLVAFIEKKSNVFGKRIQGVEIYDKFSFVNVSFNDAESILDAFRGSQGKRSLVTRAKS